MNILINILTISIFCNGWFIITHDGMLLDGFRIWLDSKLPATGLLRFFYKPFIGCVICYSSIWGSSIYYILNDLTFDNFMTYPVIIISSAFTNYLLFNLLELIKKHAD